MTALKLNGNITAVRAEEILGLGASFISRNFKSEGSKEKILSVAKMLHNTRLDFSELQSKINDFQNQLGEKQSLIDSLSNENKKLQNDLEELQRKSVGYKFDNGALQKQIDNLKSEKESMQKDLEELQSFKDNHEGKNFITKLIGDGITSTLIALGVSSFTFLALQTLMVNFLGSGATIASLAISICLLHFTIRKNQISRDICVGFTFVIAALFSGFKYSRLDTDLQSAWTIAAAILFAVLPPVIEWRITKELQ